MLNRCLSVSEKTLDDRRFHPAGVAPLAGCPAHFPLAFGAGFA
ncbi:MAG: hypothetical protein ACYYK0_02145 [Candidatus Eutrophobiaceae bacterium]